MKQKIYVDSRKNYTGSCVSSIRGLIYSYEASPERYREDWPISTSRLPNLDYGAFPEVLLSARYGA